MHSIRLLVAIALCLTVTLAQAAGFRFIDAPAVADGPPLKGAMWYPCWLPQQAEYARFQLGGIVVPVALDLPVCAGWCNPFLAHHPCIAACASLSRSYGPMCSAVATRPRLRRSAFDVALSCETPSYLHSEFDRQLAVGTIGILLPIDKNVTAVRAKALMRAHQSPKPCPARPPKTFAISDCATRMRAAATVCSATSSIHTR
jgi:hypothetical protein